MASTILSKLAKGMQPTRQMFDDAMNWFGGKLEKLSLMKLNYDVGHSSHAAPLPGTMMFFSYPNAKYKKTLPYWDTFPIVLPFHVQADRFWGLNLHYLPLSGRIMLLSSLQPLVIDSRLSGQRKMQLSWELLKKYASHPALQQTVHQYLLTGNHIGSQFMMVDSDEWANAALLPRERFVTEQGGQKRKSVKPSWL